MPILATTSSQPKELIPAGNYVAICYEMIHIGTVTEFIMGEPKVLNKVRIGWELPTERKVFNSEKGEQPFVHSEEYTLSMHEKSNLRKTLASWRGKDFTEEEAKSFDITKLLDKSCMLNLIHKPTKSDPSKIYVKLGSVSPVPKGMNIPERTNPIRVLSYDNFDYNLFNSLPDWIKDKIVGSNEFKALQTPNSTTFDANHIDEPIDDLPF